MKAKAVAVLVLACMTGMPCASSALAQHGDVAVVVSPQNGTSTLSLGELRKVFNGEKHFWPSGSTIKLLVRPSGSRERNTLLNLLGMSESEYKQYWTSQIYRGEARSEPRGMSRKLWPHTRGDRVGGGSRREIWNEGIEDWRPHAGRRALPSSLVS